jgi:hypothetical protein
LERSLGLNSSLRLLLDEARACPGSESTLGGATAAAGEGLAVEVVVAAGESDGPEKKLL